MSTLIPYYKINPNSESDAISIILNCFKEEIVVIDSYCANPDCNCKDITLTFTNHKTRKILCSFMINYETLNISNKIQIDKTFPCDQAINEFVNDFIELRTYYEKRYQEVKAYTRKNPLINTSIDEIYKLILEGSLVPYWLISENPELNQSMNEYIIEDYYCMNPSCHCNDVTLAFFIDRNNHPKFTVTLKLNTKEYSVREKHCGSDLINSVMHKLINDNKKLLSLYKKRYLEMKDISKKVLNLKRSKQTVTSKIGPNEPCPCGSGKKYKKCCGC